MKFEFIDHLLRVVYVFLTLSIALECGRILTDSCNYVLGRKR